MAVRGAREQIEVFHLCFLRLLTAGGDRGHYVVKGGCNLRFWFGSVRYSEDLDLDVTVTARGSLKNKVDRILEGVALSAVLRTQGLDLRAVTAPKQTDTTQRWKVALSTGTSAALHTKVEFSRRGSSSGHAFAPVDGEVARAYGVVAPMAHHYLAPAAIAQKVGALAHRSETQARDVFDLHLLFTRRGQDEDELSLERSVRADLGRAIERAMDVSYDEYRGQVVAFLHPDHAAPFASRAAWDQMQSDVVSALEALVP